MNGVPMPRALTASVKRVASTDDLLYYLEERPASWGRELALEFSEEFDAWVRETYEEGETDEDSLDEIIAGEDSRTLMLDLPDWVWEEWYESRAWEPALRADLAYAPSWYLMSDPEPFTGLAVHFTDAPEKVASQGFRYGVRDESRLGLTRHLDDYDARPGYNFAYVLKDWKKYARKSDGTYRYGQGAVVFPVKGVSVWHSGDKERQVIFWGPDVRSGITPVVKTKGGWESRGQVYGDLESALDGFRFSQRLSASPISMSASVERVASRYVAKQAGLLKAPPAMVKEITEWVQTNVARMVARSSDSVRLSEPVRALAQKHGGAAPPEKDARFFMGLRGWPYLSSFGNDAGKAETLLKLQGFGVIRVRITTNKGNRLAAWDNRNLELVVNPFAGNYDLRSKRAYIQWMKRIGSSVNHELQHMTQRIIKVLAGAHEYGGLPSRRIRDHEYTPAGFSVADPKLPKKQYYLRDAEFYTWLSGEVRRFNEYASHAHFPKDRWDEARRSFVDAVNDPMEWGGYMVVDASPFFRALRENEPAKWRKAVGEFWKATEVPRSSRVASRYAGKTAGMKTPSDLPEGWYVEISGSLSNVGIYLLDDSDNAVGSLDIHRTGNFLQINEIQARQGWGPLLYDLALEVANEFDDEGLMPDRSMVSREAQAVWDYYLNRRSDVEATPLPESVLELGGAGHVRTRLDRYESDSPLSYSYRKTTGNPFMRQLASQGQLESDDYSFSLPAVRSASRHRMVLSLDSHEVKAPRGWIHIEEVEIIPDPKGMFDPTGQDHEILTVDWVMDPDGPDEASHVGMPLREFLRMTGLSGRVVSGVVADAYEDQASKYEDRLTYRG